MFRHNARLRKRRPSSPPVFGRGGEKPPPLPKWEGRREASCSPLIFSRGSRDAQVEQARAGERAAGQRAGVERGGVGGGPGPAPQARAGERAGRGAGGGAGGGPGPVPQARAGQRAGVERGGAEGGRVLWLVRLPPLEGRRILAPAALGRRTRRRTSGRDSDLRGVQS